MCGSSAAIAAASCALVVTSTTLTSATVAGQTSILKPMILAAATDWCASVHGSMRPACTGIRHAVQPCVWHMACRVNLNCINEGNATDVQPCLAQALVIQTCQLGSQVFENVYFRPHDHDHIAHESCTCTHVSFIASKRLRTAEGKHGRSGH
jgi:hypothetical protein